MNTLLAIRRLLVDCMTAPANSPTTTVQVSFTGKLR